LPERQIYSKQKSINSFSFLVFILLFDKFLIKNRCIGGDGQDKVYKDNNLNRIGHLNR